MGASSQRSARVSGEVARGGFFVVALVLGTALIVSSITSYLGASTLLDTVIRGQAQSLHRDLLQQLRARDHHGPPSDEELRSFVDANADQGVRGLAITGPRGELLVMVGEGVARDALRPNEIRVRGDRVQAGFAMDPPPPGGRRPEGRRLDDAAPELDPPSDGPPPGSTPGAADEGRRRRRPPPIVTIEFVPEAALALRARSQRDLGVGLTVAMALLLGAVVFGRLSRRAQAAELRLANQRHLAVLGEMSAVLAHEIRNPLASLKGHAQLLAERVQGEAGLERKVARIVDETLRLESLTRGLLDFARTGGIERAEVDPAALLRARAEACESEVRVDDAGAPARWWLDGAKLEQVLDNLLDNARQAAPEGVIEARVRAEGRRLVFEVCDHGPGVPVEQRERIFQPFHTTRTRGTGLGLAISRRIVELHDGVITVDDAPGGGARFRVKLPSRDPA